jgi:hypothetical protein
MHPIVVSSLRTLRRSSTVRSRNAVAGVARFASGACVAARAALLRVAVSVPAVRRV